MTVVLIIQVNFGVKYKSDFQTLHSLLFRAIALNPKITTLRFLNKLFFYSSVVWGREIFFKFPGAVRSPSRLNVLFSTYRLPQCGLKTNPTVQSDIHLRNENEL